jgi:hypothetical protein
MCKHTYEGFALPCVESLEEAKNARPSECGHTHWTLAGSTIYRVTKYRSSSLSISIHTTEFFSTSFAAVISFFSLLMTVGRVRGALRNLTVRLSSPLRFELSLGFASIILLCLWRATSNKSPQGIP